MADGEVTKDGERLIKNWLSAQEHLRNRQSDLTSAECHLTNAATNLAKWMLPGDEKPGEKIAVWFGDSLIQVEVTDSNPVVTVRTRGKHLYR